MPSPAVPLPTSRLAALPLAAAAFLAPPMAVFAPILVASLFAIAGLGAIGVLAARRERLAHVPLAIAAPLVLLALWGTASALWSVIPERSFAEGGRQLAIVAGGLALVTLGGSLSPGERRQVETALLAGYLLGLAALFAESLTEGALLRGGRALLGIAEEPFVFKVVYNRATSALALLVWPVLLALARRERFVQAAVVIALTLVVLTEFQNSTSVLALSAGIVVLAAGYLRARPVRTLLGVGCAIALLAAPLVVQSLLRPADVAARFPGLSMPAFHRIAIWEFAAERIDERPILGWGLDASRAIPGGHDRIRLVLPGRAQDGARPGQLREAMVEAMPLHPHNTPLQLRLELGLPGALLGAALVLLLVRATARGSPGRVEAGIRLAALTAAVVIALLSYGVWQSWWLSVEWLTAALLVALHRHAAAKAER